LHYTTMTKELYMPTSYDEAKKIQEIMNDFLTVDQAKEITRRLDKEVGEKTDNNSLKASLNMLKTLYE
jgi:hypothetical protein